MRLLEDSRLLVLGFEKLEETTYELQKVCIKSGKKINFDKCRVLKPFMSSSKENTQRM